MNNLTYRGRTRTHRYIETGLLRHFSRVVAHFLGAFVVRNTASVAIPDAPQV
jgi:hypothetical protein